MRELKNDKNFHFLNLISLVSVMSNVLNPAFGVISEAFDITPDQVGLLTTIYSIPMVILSPVVGVIADRVGRKNILAISSVIFGLSAILSLMAENYETLLLSEFLRGIGQPGLVIVTIVLIGDLYEEKMRNRVMGLNTAVMNAGLAILPVIGGVLAGMSWKYPYAVILLAIPIGIGAFWGLQEPTVKKKETKMFLYLKEALAYYKNGRVLVISLISFAVYCLLAGCFLVYAAFLLEDPSWIGIVFAVMSVTSCIPSIFTETLIKAVGEERLMRITFAVFTAAFLIGANANTVPLAILFSGVFGIGIGIIMPVQMIMLLPLSPEHVRGTFISVQNLIHRLGQAVGPVIFGYLFVKFDLDGVFYGAAIISAIIFVVALKLLRKEN